MVETTELLKNYTKRKHIQTLISKIQPINFKIKTINSTNWINNINLPHVTISYLLDSYSCLPQRPDMAFTFLWKSFNSCYKKIAIDKILNSNNPNERLTDSLALDKLIEEIDNRKNDFISTNYKIIDLINDFTALIPIKPFKFLSNNILKGYAMEQANVPNVLIGSTYSSFKRSYPIIFQNIIDSYGQAFKTICAPIVSNNKVNLQITNLHKSKSIPESLAIKLEELLKNKTVTFQNSGNTNSYTLTINTDKEYLSFLIKTILYSIRNNSVHGNIVSRLNSDYVNNASLITAIYIYFLGHLFLSIALYLNGEITASELNINKSNLKILRKINNHN